MFSLCIPTMDRFDFLKSYLPKYINNNLVREIIICDENGNDYKKIDFLKKKYRCYDYFKKEIRDSRKMGHYIILDQLNS